MAIANGVAAERNYPAKSGIGAWIDPATPTDKRTYSASRGGRDWELVMSDEFNTPNRSFKPGDDHMWTSLEQPDGVNGALELYSHNMTSTKCDDEGGDTTCFLYIKVVDEVNNVSVYNAFKRPPTFEKVSFFYRAAMLQSWNKFCFQGGMLEVRAQLPGAISAESGNPDLALGDSAPVSDKRFYPTWPGIWMMGNLGRAIFSASTSRMWPFSYDRCEPELFDPSNQRISACDDNPGYGMNPNQGRGAPEIDLLEGGGSMISSSMQIAPGMPTNFRLFPADADGVDETNPWCVYSYDCLTPGANYIDVPTAYYEKQRGHKSWYQSLRYASNNFCSSVAGQVQTYESVARSLEAGVKDNECTVATCPGSLDVNSDLSLIDSDILGEGVAESRGHWGINTNGTCFPVMNSYMGAYLCDPDNTNELCLEPRNATTPKSEVMAPFNYQMDAISANWPIHVGGYTGYLVYQLEWVTGEHGYVRWMLDGHVLFEVTTASITDVPQDAGQSNPIKLMIEEPMSIVLNVALSRSWGVAPPNPGFPCRGDGLDSETNAICDSFPMYMKIDYVRVYQDPQPDAVTGGYMQVGCDPASHPTKGWIEGHLDEYQNDANPVIAVAGKGFCSVDDDCTIGRRGADGQLERGAPRIVTGKCSSGRCECSHPDSWGGPRCTTALGEAVVSPLQQTSFGPSMALTLVVAILNVSLSLATVYSASRKARRREAAEAAEPSKKKFGAYSDGGSCRVLEAGCDQPRGASTGGASSFSESLRLSDRGSSFGMFFV